MHRLQQGEQRAHLLAAPRAAAAARARDLERVRCVHTSKAAAAQPRLGPRGGRGTLRGERASATRCASATAAAACAAAAAPAAAASRLGHGRRGTRVGQDDAHLHSEARAPRAKNEGAGAGCGCGTRVQAAGVWRRNSGLGGRGAGGGCTGGGTRLGEGAVLVWQPLLPQVEAQPVDRARARPAASATAVHPTLHCAAHRRRRIGLCKAELRELLQ